MSNMSEDIQYAGSDARPPMLDRTDFESWQQRIRLYCLGKDNGENIMKSITKGPFQMGTMRDTLTEGGEGALHLGPERARVFADLSAEQKDMYKADIRATNILLQGIPKDIYTLINHFTDAKDIWDNVKMILEGSELTKLINDMRNIKMTMSRMQLNSKFVNNMLPEWSRFITEVKLNRGKTISEEQCKRNVIAGNAGRLNRDGKVNPGQAKTINTRECKAMYNTWEGKLLIDSDDDYTNDSNIIPYDPGVQSQLGFAPTILEGEPSWATFAPQRNLTPEQIFWSIDENDKKKAETSVPKPLSALTVYPPNTPVKLVPRVLPTKSQVKINLYVLTQLFMEFDKTCKKRITPTGVTEGERDKQCAKIVKKNLLIENENLIANCLSNQLLYDVEKSRCLDLEAEVSRVHNESKHISKLEREYLNLQLKYQHLQESFDNNKSQTSQEAPDFNSFFKIKNSSNINSEKDNEIRDLKTEIEKVKQHYKELFESIKITRASTNEQTSSLLTQIEDLKAQLEGNLKVATRSSVKTKVLAPGMYAIDVKPIPHPLKNNRSAHLTYINHLKESVETVREIVEEARVVKPLDNALNYAFIH
ncbi:hypothetical protein Tco_0040161 [Tanacetum coccineum]